MTSSRKVEGLADRQGFFSEVRKRSTDVPSAGARPAEGPWISLSRQAGSGGTELAAAVARSLGWSSYDREILTAIAEETRSDELALERFDEHAVREFDEYLAPLIVPDNPGQARYLVEMTRIVARLARQGRAVFIGRGVNWVLTPACGLRVRAVGPFEARAANVARARGVPLEEARRLATENDAAQRAFIRQAFHREIDDPSGYDLVLNSVDLGPEASLAAVIAAAKAKLRL